MEYKGKLYGRFCGKHFDTGHTSEDWDKLKAENTRLKEQHKSEMLEEYDKGYGEGYADATSEAITEIQKNYEPKQ